MSVIASNSDKVSMMLEPLGYFVSNTETYKLCTIQQFNEL